jgi:hypothetical protein
MEGRATHSGVGRAAIEESKMDLPILGTLLSFFLELDLSYTLSSITIIFYNTILYEMDTAK